MDELFLQMIQLRRFMVSDATFSDPANKREIQSHLEKLTELGQAAKHSSLLRARGLQIYREVLVSHLKETTQSFENGNPTYGALDARGHDLDLFFVPHTSSDFPESSVDQGD